MDIYTSRYRQFWNCRPLRVWVAACALDTDGDGIPDATDVDDDNDGGDVLGVVQVVQCHSGWFFDGHTPTAAHQGACYQTGLHGTQGPRLE